MAKKSPQWVGYVERGCTSSFECEILDYTSVYIQYIYGFDMGFNACTCSLDPINPTSNAHVPPTKCPVNAANPRAKVLEC